MNNYNQFYQKQKSMRWSRKKRWQYTAKGMSTDSAKHPLPLNKDITSPKWYQNINELPLRKFREIVISDNLHALVISGQPTEEQLLTAWDSIRMQYADAMKDNDFRAYCTLSRETAYTQATYNQITICIRTLRKFYAEQFKNGLNALLRTSYVLDVSDREKYDKDLDSATRRSKGVLIDLKLKQSTLAGMEKKMAEKGNGFTHEYFDSMLITLSDEAGFRLSEDITVYEYCERCRRMQRKIDLLNTKPHGGKRR
jgi:hypothetical protein